MYQVIEICTGACEICTQLISIQLRSTKMSVICLCGAVFEDDFKLKLRNLLRDEAAQNNFVIECSDLLFLSSIAHFTK